MTKIKTMNSKSSGAHAYDNIIDSKFVKYEKKDNNRKYFLFFNKELEKKFLNYLYFERLLYIKLIILVSNLILGLYVLFDTVRFFFGILIDDTIYVKIVILIIRMISFTFSIVIIILIFIPKINKNIFILENVLFVFIIITGLFVTVLECFSKDNNLAITLITYLLCIYNFIQCRIHIYILNSLICFIFYLILHIFFCESLYHYVITKITLIIICIIEISRRYFIERIYRNVFLNKIEIDEIKQNISEQKKKEDEILKNIFPEKFLKSIKNVGNVIKCYNDLVVLYCDIVDFTKFSLSVESMKLVKILNDIYEEFDNITSRKKLEKIKTIGDAYFLCSLNIIEFSKHKTVIAGLKMIKSLQKVNSKYNINIEIRMGIDSGQCYVAILGDRYLNFDCFGKAVFNAKYLESMSNSNKILTSFNIYESLNGTNYNNNIFKFSKHEINGKTFYFVSDLSKSNCNLTKLILLKERLDSTLSNAYIIKSLKKEKKLVYSKYSKILLLFKPKIHLKFFKDFRFSVFSDISSIINYFIYLYLIQYCYFFFNFSFKLNILQFLLILIHFIFIIIKMFVKRHYLISFVIIFINIVIYSLHLIIISINPDVFNYNNISMYLLFFCFSIFSLIDLYYYFKIIIILIVFIVYFIVCTFFLSRDDLINLVVFFLTFFCSLLFGEYFLQNYLLQNYKYESDVKMDIKKLNNEIMKNEKLLNSSLPNCIVENIMNKKYEKKIPFENIKDNTVVFCLINIESVKFFNDDETYKNINHLNAIIKNLDMICDSNECTRIKCSGFEYLFIGSLYFNNVNMKIDRTKKCSLRLLDMLLKYFDKNELKWTVKIGVHFGNFTSGIVGKTRFLFDVFGDVINTAHRIAENSPNNKILCSEHYIRKLYPNKESIFKEINLKGRGKLKCCILK